MNQLKKLLVVLPALALILGLTTTPVFARDGNGDSSSEQAASSIAASSSAETENSTSTSAQSEPNDKTGTNDTASKKAEVESEVRTEAKDAAQGEIESESKGLIDRLKKTEKEHSEADRQKNCAAAEKGLETKLSNLSKNASAFHVRIDNVLAMAIAYQKDNNISVNNFDALVATAQAAQTKSASSISALNALNPNLNCADANVAQNVAEFKVAAAQARTDLKAYKQAVIAVLTALEAAKGGN